MKTATCPNCDRQFAFTRPRKFCDRRCAATVRLQARGVAVWEPAALLHLEQLTGFYPGPELAKRFNSQAKKQGWAQRTETAIVLKLRRQGCSRKATLDNFTKIEMARTLQINLDRVKRWVKIGLLPYKKVSRNLGAISLSEFRKFADSYWQELRSVNLEALAWLGVNPKTIEKVSRLPPAFTGAPQPVKRLDTGETFYSVKEAARRCYINWNGIVLSIQQQKPVSGIQWEVAA